MKANELRIGNWVLDTFDKSATCELQIDLDCFVMMSNFKNSDNHLLPFKPIQLTPEWLIKLGFEEKLNSYVKPHPEGVINYVVDGVGDNFHIGRNSDMDLQDIEFFAWDIKYVHTLQNIIFSLTGVELPIVEYDQSK